MTDVRKNKYFIVRADGKRSRPAAHLFHSNSALFLETLTNTVTDILFWIMDELEQTASQSIKN